MEWKADRYESLLELFRMYEDGGYTDNEIRKYFESVTYLRFNDEQMKSIRKHMEIGLPERKKTPELIEEIQKWFKERPHRYTPETNVLPSFVYSLKFKEEQTKRMLVDYYRIRGLDDELFGNRDPFSPGARQFQELSYMGVCEGFTDELYSIVLVGLLEHEVRKFNIVDAARQLLNVGDILVKESICTGQIIIIDLQYVTLQHVVRLPLFFVKKALKSLIQKMPARIKGIHLVYASNLSSVILALVKPFLKKKIADRLHFHPSLESLHKHVSKKSLPKEYGGENGTVEDINKQWLRKLEQNREYFLNLEKVLKEVYRKPDKEEKSYWSSMNVFKPTEVTHSV